MSTAVPYYIIAAIAIMTFLVIYNTPKPQGVEDFVSTPGTIGELPPIPLCDQCHLGSNCPNYTFNGQQNVCHVCSQSNANYSNLRKPIYVNARAAGRPRQCRQIIANL